jgi:hypothetical protein
MKQFITSLVLMSGASWITGCAHPMIIKPDIAALEVVGGGQHIDKSVGLYISPANRAKQVTTKGGGGDKVTYHPYEDNENAAALRAAIRLVRLDDAGFEVVIARTGDLHIDELANG